MTPEQYERWKDFSIRMAKTAFKGQRRPGPKHILACVEEFFADIDSGSMAYDRQSILAINHWDDGPEYPEGHEFRNREHQSSYCGCDGYRHKHKKPNPKCPECHGSGVHHAWNTLPCLSTALADYEEHWIPDYWHDMDSPRWEHRRDRWCGNAICCIRAGLGAAVERGSGMGVLGFTAGDIRRMFPEGVPDWVARGWDDGETIATKAVIPGVGFVPEVTGKSPKFEDMPDTAGVWL